MPKRECISFVMLGTGNLAFHLTDALVHSGYKLKQVVGRSARPTKKFAGIFNSNFCNHLKHLDYSADVYFVCVSDDQIPVLTKQINLQNKLIVHCSGAVEMSVLKNCSSNYGVLYPLYTFSKDDHEIDFRKVPFFIEGNSSRSLSAIKKIALNLSEKVKVMKSLQRRKLHLSAVLSANFTNYLIGLAALYLKRERSGNINDLLPLLEKTILKLHHQQPVDAQTGPARRNDAETMREHLHLLQHYPEHKKVYRFFSAAIIKRYHSEKHK